MNITILETILCGGTLALSLASLWLAKGPILVHVCTHYIYLVGYVFGNGLSMRREIGMIVGFESVGPGTKVPCYPYLYKSF